MYHFKIDNILNKDAINFILNKITSMTFYSSSISFLNKYAFRFFFKVFNL